MPYSNGQERPAGPPHDLVFGLPRDPGPPHDLFFGRPYVEPCDPDWEDLDGLSVDVNFATCETPTPDTNAESFTWSNADATTDPGPSEVNFSWVYDGDWTEYPGNEVFVDFDCCDGEQPPVVIGLIDLVVGEVLDGELTRFLLFDPTFHEGATAFAAVEAPEAIFFDPSFYEGASVGIDNLETTIVLDVSVHTGEFMSAVVLDAPSEPIGILRGYDGPTMFAAVEKFTFVGTDHYTGETMFAEVEDDPYEGIVGDMYEGSTAEAEVQVSPGFIAPMYTGETGQIDNLATDATLAPNAYVGEFMSAVVQDSPPWYPEFNFYEGAALTPTLNFGDFAIGFFPGHTGETLTAVVADRPAETLSFTMYEGASGTFDMSLAANLGVIDARDGATVTADTIDFDEIWQMYDGATMVGDVSTEDTMSPNAYSGETATASVTDFPSEGMGTFRAYDGAALESGPLTALVAVFLSVNFVDSYMFQAGLPALGSYFDLDVSCCTDHDPGQQDIHHIELNHAPFPDEHYHGDRVKIDADLSTNQRFSFNFYTGETASTVDNVPYILGANSFDGAAASFNFESEVNFRLCPGNFIPDGDNVVVELDFTDNEDCDANYARTGESLELTYLEANQNFQPGKFTGETMIFDLFVPTDQLSLRAYAGETMSLPTEFDPTFRTGESAAFQFYEAPIVGAHGEYMEADITIRYEVRFDEVGCLDNDFIYQDENGDPIPEKFNPVPVELDPYQHDILARCF